MINKIKSKVNRLGFKKTIHLIIEKIRKIILINCNFTLNKKNKLNKEWTVYWKSYKYIEKRYKNALDKTEKKKGSGKFSKIIWWCWLQGEEEIPPFQQKCLQSIKKHIKDREIKIISLKNLSEYIELPEYIIDKYNKGIISNTHLSDLIRLELLCKYGGTWIDSTAYITSYDKNLFDKNLFVYKNCNRFWFANKNEIENEPIIADNWFITAEIDNPILCTVKDLLYDYWKNNNYLIDYFIFHYLFTLTVNYKYKDEFNKILTLPHVNPHILQYEMFNNFDKVKFESIKKLSSIHKLTYKVSESQIKKNSFYMYILKGDEIGGK